MGAVRPVADLYVSGRSPACQRGPMALPGSQTLAAQRSCVQGVSKPETCLYFLFTGSVRLPHGDPRTLSWRTAVDTKPLNSAAAAWLRVSWGLPASALRWGDSVLPDPDASAWQGHQPDRVKRPLCQQRTWAAIETGPGNNCDFMVCFILFSLAAKPDFALKMQKGPKTNHTCFRTQFRISHSIYRSGPQSDLIPKKKTDLGIVAPFPNTLQTKRTNLTTCAMRQPRTDREPGPPPAFQQSTHKNQSTSFLPHLPDFGKRKTLPISCQNTVNFIGLSGSGRARGALVPCLVPFLPNLLRPIAFRRKKQMKPDTMPVLHRALILPQYFISVSYILEKGKL